MDISFEYATGGILRFSNLVEETTDPEEVEFTGHFNRRGEYVGKAGPLDGSVTWCGEASFDSRFKFKLMPSPFVVGEILATITDPGTRDKEVILADFKTNSTTPEILGRKYQQHGRAPQNSWDASTIQRDPNQGLAYAAGLPWELVVDSGSRRVPTRKSLLKKLETQVAPSRVHSKRFGKYFLLIPEGPSQIEETTKDYQGDFWSENGIYKDEGRELGGYALTMFNPRAIKSMPFAILQLKPERGENETERYTKNHPLRRTFSYEGPIEIQEPA